MKIYLAGKFNEANNIRLVANMLPSSVTISAPWYDFEQADAAVRGAEETFIVGKKELDGVVTADYYVGIINDSEYPYKGTLTEMGIALGWYHAHGLDLGNRVIIITPKHFNNNNCMALRVPHTALATHAPIMEGNSIPNNRSLIGLIRVRLFDF
jgi:hypothetical protein